jgi:hypothetical protein
MSEGKGRHLHVDIANLSVIELEDTGRPVRRRKRPAIVSTFKLADFAKHFPNGKAWIEYLAARYHRDPTQFHLAQNRTGFLDPEELAAEIDLVLSVRAPRF